MSIGVVELAGTRCLVQGPGPGRADRTILLLHGFGGAASHWGPLMRELPRGVRAIAPDLPGHGFCALPCDAAERDITRLVSDLLQELEASGRIGVIGHSLGSLLGIRVALRLAHRVSWLGLVGSARRVRLHPRLIDRLSLGEVDEKLLAAGVRDAPDEARGLVVSAFHHVRLPDASVDVWGVRHADLGTDAARLAIPAAVLIPAADRLVSPYRGRALARTLRYGHAVEIPGADHYVHLERPELVWACLAPWLARFAER
jgi:long-chain acyl-CoA synthetase